MRWSLVLAMGCSSGELIYPSASVATCGDGVTDESEECDDGDANALASDTCRPGCVLPLCGDGILDATEVCDDANKWGGDGCTPTCAVESGNLEAEPNDVGQQSNPLGAGETVAGSLPAGDVDCFSVTVATNEWIDATASGPDGTCPPDLVSRLYGPQGDALEDAYGADPTTCAHLDPFEHPGATYLTAGDYSVCVEGLFRAEVPSYRLTLEVGDDSCLIPSGGTDTDGDGIADPCDSDDDGDTVLDDDDNCPLFPNGGGEVFTTNADGYLTHWLMAGVFTGNDVGAFGDCHPSEVDLLDASGDGAANPALGDTTTDGTPWVAWLEPDGVVSISDVYSLPSPAREVYATSFVWLADATDALLAMGADDGSRAWVNGVMVGEDPTCHGVTADALTYPVSLDKGWNRVSIKVRDAGGGFGFTVRLKDVAGSPLPGLAASLRDGTWSDNQTDSDGDGVGDVCDPTP